MVELTDQVIDTQQVLDRVQTHAAGAVVLFLGTTRQFTRGRETLSLDYECYRPMARAKLQELEAEAGRAGICRSCVSSIDSGIWRWARPVWRSRSVRRIAKLPLRPASG